MYGEMLDDTIDRNIAKLVRIYATIENHACRTFITFKCLLKGGFLMKENQASLTSLITAYARAYHAMHDDPKIFNDFLANRLFTEEERTNMDKNLAQLLNFIDPERAAFCPDQATALAWVMRLETAPVILSRARYIEACLETAVVQGVEQYVILGAGMDTFAFRRPDMLEQLHVFEVDHPTTQAFKCNRLAELGWEHPSQLHFIPVDFTKDNLTSVLKHSSFNPQALSFFSWLGVTMDLTRDEVFNTLSAIADITPAGSAIIFDYLSNDTFTSGNSAKQIELTKENTQRVEEPMKTFFDPYILAADLAKIGLRLHENLNPTNIEERFFQKRNDGYHASGNSHFAYAVFE
jgi:methyltransferase (TIGR00027 family)